MKTRLIYLLKSPIFLLSFFFIFFIFRYGFLISSNPWPSSDLPAQVLIIEQYRTYWYKGLISFYDPTTFTGWPVHFFYGFLPFFITAPISYLFDLFASDSVTLTINTMIVLVSSSLIFSLYFAAKPFFEELLKSFDNEKLFDKADTLKAYFILLLGLLCFWFLNSDHQDASVGIGAPLFTGLYGQMFGWHAFLLYIGLMARFINNNKKSYIPLIAISVCLLLFCHTLSAVFGFSIGALCFFWFQNKRIKIFKAHIIGIALSGMWLFPFLRYMSEYTINSPINTSDFIEVIFRYPLFNLYKSIKSTILGDFVLINYTYLLVIALVITAFVSRFVRKTRLLSAFLFFTILLIALFTSGYIVRSVPISLHYYRFTGLIMLLALTLLSVVFLHWFNFIVKKKNEYFGLFGIIFVLLFGICFFFNINIQHPYIFEIKRDRDIIKQQFMELEKVYGYFKDENSQGRVFIEYLNDYENFPPPISH
ncbi:MAG: hypothetical protein ACRENO_06635, partial [Thermodesulfobacteriota bacterium]